MVVAVSSQVKLPPVLRPRRVVPEKTPDELREERRRSILAAVEGDLHVLYDRYAASSYSGPLNSHQGVSGVVPSARPSLSSPGAGYSRALGVELHHDFISYLDKDHLQAALWQALVSLREEWPSLHQLIWAHLSEDLTDEQLGEKFHLDRNTVAKRMDRGLGIVAGKLGAWRN